MGSLYQSNIAEAYGSTDTGLAQYARQKAMEDGGRKEGAKTGKVAYAKLRMTEPGVARVGIETHGSTKSLFTRRLASKLAATGHRSGIPSLLSLKKASDSVDSGTDVASPEEKEGPNFDLLFENPEKYPLGLRTPNRISPSATMEDIVDTDVEASRWDIKYLGRSESDESKRQQQRRNSAFETTLTQILSKHYHTSGGLAGFRHRVANDISHKYFSFCRCDDVVFLFLHVVFGIVYISAGTFGVLHCPREMTMASYLLADGVLSVFVFPITIVEWTRRIGGCLSENEKLDRGVLFVAIVLLRVAAAVAGTVILVLRAQQPPEDAAFCHTVHVLMLVGVFVEWGFLVVVIVLPLCLYLCAYIVAKTCL